MSARFSEPQLSTAQVARCGYARPTGKIRLLSRARKCFCDRRHLVRIVHELAELLALRLYGLTLVYEDLNDHEKTGPESERAA